MHTMSFPRFPKEVAVCCHGFPCECRQTTRILRVYWQWFSILFLFWASCNVMAAEIASLCACIAKTTSHWNSQSFLFRDWLCVQDFCSLRGAQPNKQIHGFGEPGLLVLSVSPMGFECNVDIFSKNEDWRRQLVMQNQYRRLRVQNNAVVTWMQARTSGIWWGSVLLSI